MMYTKRDYQYSTMNLSIVRGLGLLKMATPQGKVNIYNQPYMNGLEPRKDGYTKPVTSKSNAK